MIKFHFHSTPRAIPQLGVARGDRMCHVYSDGSEAELVAWGKERGLRPEWIDRRNALPHFDVPASEVAEHEPGVLRAELVRDLRVWHARRARGETRGADPHGD